MSAVSVVPLVPWQAVLRSGLQFRRDISLMVLHIDVRVQMWLDRLTACAPSGAGFVLGAVPVLLFRHATPLQLDSCSRAEKRSQYYVWYTVGAPVHAHNWFRPLCVHVMAQVSNHL